MAKKHKWHNDKPMFYIWAVCLIFFAILFLMLPDTGWGATPISVVYVDTGVGGPILMVNPIFVEGTVTELEITADGDTVIINSSVGAAPDSVLYADSSAFADEASGDSAGTDIFTDYLSLSRGGTMAAGINMGVTEDILDIDSTDALRAGITVLSVGDIHAQANGIIEVFDTLDMKDCNILNVDSIFLQFIAKDGAGSINILDNIAMGSNSFTGVESITGTGNGVILAFEAISTDSGTFGVIVGDSLKVELIVPGGGTYNVIGHESDRFDTVSSGYIDALNVRTTNLIGALSGNLVLQSTLDANSQIISGAGNITSAGTIEGAILTEGGINVIVEGDDIELLDGTASRMPWIDAAGDIKAEIGLGSAGQVLTSTGINTQPTMQNAPTGIWDESNDSSWILSADAETTKVITDDDAGNVTWGIGDDQSSLTIEGRGDFTTIVDSLVRMIGDGTANLEYRYVDTTNGDSGATRYNVTSHIMEYFNHGGSWTAIGSGGGGTTDSTYINTDGAATQYGPFTNDMFKLKEGTGIDIVYDDSTTYHLFRITSTLGTSIDLTSEVGATILPIANGGSGSATDPDPSLTDNNAVTLGDGASGDFVLTFDGDAGNDLLFTWSVAGDSLIINRDVKIEGNFFLTGTVDGVDLAALNTQLANDTGNYRLGYDHSQDNTQAHTDYLLNNASDATSGVLTAAGFTIGAAAIVEAELEILDGATLTTTELNYVDGVTSAIQTQIDLKAPLASPTFTGMIKGDSMMLGTMALQDGSGDTAILNVSHPTPGRFDAGNAMADAHFGDSIAGLVEIGFFHIGMHFDTTYNGGLLSVGQTVQFGNKGTPTGPWEFLFYESSNNIRFGIPSSGNNKGTYNPRSMIIAGPAILDDTICFGEYWGFDNLAMITGGDGADLGVQNDFEVLGQAFIDTIKASAEAQVTIDDALKVQDMIMGETGFTLNLDADSNITINGRTNPRNMALGAMRINLTPAISGTRAITLDIDMDGLGDTKGLVVDYTATGMAAGQFGTAIQINADKSTATGGEYHAIDVTAIGTGSVDIDALGVRAGVNPIHHHSGSEGDIEKVWGRDSTGTAWSDLTTAFGSAAVDSEFFSGDNDYIYIGNAAVFDEMEFSFAATASGAGVKPIFEYWSGAAWTTFNATDNTSGFRNNGAIEIPVLSGWATSTVNGTTDKYWIRIQRTANSLSTAPTEDLVQYVSSVSYTWDSDGDLSIRDITIRGTVTLSGSDSSASWYILDTILEVRASNETTFVEPANNTILVLGDSGITHITDLKLGINDGTDKTWLFPTVKGTDAQLWQYTTTGDSLKWITMSGDLTMVSGGAVTIAANAVESTMVGADQINDLDINWGSGTDQVDLADILGGIAPANAFNFSAATLEIPQHATAPAPTNEGEIVQDTDDDMIEGTDGTSDFVWAERYEVKQFHIDNPDGLTYDTIRWNIRGAHPGGIIIDSVGAHLDNLPGASYKVVFQEWDHTCSDTSSAETPFDSCEIATTECSDVKGGVARTIEYGNIVAVIIPSTDVNSVDIWIRYEILGKD